MLNMDNRPTGDVPPPQDGTIRDQDAPVAQDANETIAPSSSADVYAVVLVGEYSSWMTEKVFDDSDDAVAHAKSAIRNGFGSIKKAYVVTLNPVRGIGFESRTPVIPHDDFFSEATKVTDFSDIKQANSVPVNLRY